MRSKTVLASSVLATLLAVTAAASAAEPDFYLMMQKCKITVGHLVLSDESLKVIDGDPPTFACVRQSASVSCALSLESGAQGHKGNRGQYEVLADSPPILLLSDETGGEFISINTTQRAAVIITRILALESASSKVCHGLYATSFDLKALEE